MQFLDILFFAIVAAFIILRLRSVLGRRTGHQGPVRDPFARPTPPDRHNDTVVSLPPQGEGEPLAEPAVTLEKAGDGSKTPLEAGLTQIRIADPSFDPAAFLSGSRIAFEIIVAAFASGDTETLKPLLSPEVFANFEQSIRERLQAGETMETQLVGIQSAELVEAYMAGRTAHVTVKFVSEQISVVRDAGGKVIEGDPNKVNQVVDTWTFARDTRSKDPNWVVVATGSYE